VENCTIYRVGVAEKPQDTRGSLKKAAAEAFGWATSQQGSRTALLSELRRLLWLLRFSIGGIGVYG
jgi:hypothetical protein